MKLDIEQERVRKIIRGFVKKEGNIKNFAAKVGVTYPVIYNFLNGTKKHLSEQTGEKLYNYCRKQRIKINMSDIRPHINYLSKLVRK